MMATRQDVEASARGMKPIVGTRREGAPFAHRGFSERSIRNMVTGGIDAPEQLLFMTETQLKKIQGIPLNAEFVACRNIKDGITALCGPVVVLHYTILASAMT